MAELHQPGLCAREPHQPILETDGTPQRFTLRRQLESTGTADAMRSTEERLRMGGWWKNGNDLLTITTFIMKCNTQD